MSSELLGCFICNHALRLASLEQLKKHLQMLRNR